MRLQLTLAVLLLASLSACKSKTALDYNKKIIAIETSLKDDITSTEERVGKFFEQEQYDSAAAVSERMEGLVAVKLKEVEDEKAPDVKEGDNMKKAAVRYFTYMKSVYTEYKTFAKNPTDEERKNLISISNGARDALADIQAAQKKYAEANGFKLEQK